jgi:hypothetical protein
MVSSVPKSASVERSPQELRVAGQELSSGKQTGQVFVQLSPGAVAFLTDRPVAQARVSRHLAEAVDAGVLPIKTQNTR